MRFLFFFISFVFINITLFGQSRLGSSASDIKAEFYEKTYKLKAEYDKDNDYSITIETNKATVTYYFDKEKICTGTAIIPNAQGDLNYYVELYNKQYVIVNSKEWKMYSNEGIANISLVYPDGGGYYFLWTR